MKPEAVLSRRELLIAGAAAGIGVFLVGLQDTSSKEIDVLEKNPEAVITPEEALGITSILALSLNLTSEPTFWDQFVNRLKTNPDPYFKATKQSAQRKYYEYFPGGVNSGQMPSVTIDQIETDHTLPNLHPSIVVVTLSFGENRTLGGFKKPLERVLSVPEIETLSGKYFYTPSGMRDESWQLAGQGIYEKEFKDDNDMEFGITADASGSITYSRDLYDPRFVIPLPPVPEPPSA